MSLTITFDEIKEYFEMELWTNENVKLAVEKGKITEEEYRMITNEDYVA